VLGIHDILVRIRIRIHTSEYWIRILKAQKHADPADPDPAPDLDFLHCFKEPTRKSGKNEDTTKSIKN
jgi:hypothetical protein